MKIRIKTGLWGALLCWALPVHALSLSNIASLNFGAIDYSPPATGTITIGTDGLVAYSGTYSGKGLGIAGQIEIQDSNGTLVEVSCNSGKIASAGGLVLDMENAIVIGSGNLGSWGSATSCQGLGTTVTSHTVGASTSANTIYIGARLTPASLSASVYSSANSGGQPVQVQVLIQ